MLLFKVLLFIVVSNPNDPLYPAKLGNAQIDYNQHKQIMMQQKTNQRNKQIPTPFLSIYINDGIVIWIILHSNNHPLPSNATLLHPLCQKDCEVEQSCHQQKFFTSQKHATWRH